jgi:uncharacterized protein DUF4326
MATTVVNLKHTNARCQKYIGRSTNGIDILGNPYSCKKGTLAKFLVATVEDSIIAYEAYARKRMEEDLIFKAQIADCYDKSLGCFCVDEKGEGPCHGHVLAKLAQAIHNGEL